MEQFKAYPIYMSAKHVADALQVGETFAREIMKRSGVECALGGSKRRKVVPRDKFFQYIVSLEGK